MREDIVRVEEDNLKKRKVLVFGQGPVIDSTSRLKASETNSALGNETINFWSSDMARAALTVYGLETTIKKGNPNLEFIVMGGATGGQGYASEAALIKAAMTEKGIPAEAIHTEEASSDTIENIINYLNLFDEHGENDTNTPYDIICAPYHATRLRVLMKLFDIPVGTVFRSDEVLRFTATHEYHSQKNKVVPLDSTTINTPLLLDLDNKGDMNDTGAREKLEFFARQRGTERRTANDRFLTDDIFIRELLEYPEKWLSSLPKLKDDSRIKSILHNAREWYTYKDEQGNTKDFLFERLGFDVEGEFSDVKHRLEDIRYTGIPLEQFNRMKKENITQLWPKETIDRLNTILGIT